MREIEERLQQFYVENKEWLKHKASSKKEPRLLRAIASIVLEEAAGGERAEEKTDRNSSYNKKRC